MPEKPRGCLCNAAAGLQHNAHGQITQAILECLKEGVSPSLFLTTFSSASVPGSFLQGRKPAEAPLKPLCYTHAYIQTHMHIYTHTRRCTHTHTHTLTRVRHMVNLLFLVSKTSDQTLSDGVISGISGIGDELLFKFRC